MEQDFWNCGDGPGHRRVGLAEPEPGDGGGISGEHTGRALRALKVWIVAGIVAGVAAFLGQRRARTRDFSGGTCRRTLGWAVGGCFSRAAGFGGGVFSESSGLRTALQRGNRQSAGGGPGQKIPRESDRRSLDAGKADSEGSRSLSRGARYHLF